LDDCDEEEERVDEVEAEEVRDNPLDVSYHQAMMSTMNMILMMGPSWISLVTSLLTKKTATMMVKKMKRAAMIQTDNYQCIRFLKH
jgi:hypothetical protein